jgi:hypothetical protein
MTVSVTVTDSLNAIYRPAESMCYNKITIKRKISKEEFNMKKTFGAESAAAQEMYEAKLGQEMVERVGQNQNGKGVVHEMMYRDQFNADPRNLVAGKHADLSQSTTAIRDDILIRQEGKIVGRIQAKDTARSINKTVQQVADKHYAGTRLMGTKETTETYQQAVERRAASGKAVSQKMTSTGISSKDTERIANKALGKTVSAEGVLSGAANAGAMGGAVSGLLTLGSFLVDDEDHSAEEVVGETAKSAAVGYVSGAAGFAGGELAGMLIGGTGLIPGAAAIVGAVLVGGAVASVAKPLVDDIGEGLADGIDGVGGFTDEIGDTIDDIGDTVGSIADDIGDTVGGIADDIGDTVGSIVDDIGDTIDDMATGIGDVADSFFGGFSDLVDSLFW